MDQKPKYSPREFWLSMLPGLLIGLAMMMVGYGLCVNDRGEMGLVMFGLVPFVTGLVVAMLTRDALRLAACTTASILIALSVLFITGLEGIICVVMASPILLLGAWFGGLTGYVFRRLLQRAFPSLREKPLIVLMLLLSPLMVGMASHLEKPYREVESLTTFTTSIDLPVTRDQAWQLLAQMQPLDGPRPFLIRRGLPLPLSCELESESVGARRICYFDQGRIEQTITAWEPGRHMNIRVDRSTLPGRLWLRFDSASYDLEEIPGATRVIRHTTIGSRLYPRWYWRPLEKWGVTSEHQYVLSNIRRWSGRLEDKPQAAEPAQP